jgi:hypothetical protein
LGVVPVGGAPLLVVPPGRKPPAGRDGKVTPCFLRHAVSAAREEDAPVVEPGVVELDLVVLVAATFLLDALALEPHAATPTAAASATSVTSAALDKRFAFLIVSVGPFRLKKFVRVLIRRRRAS